MMKQKLVNLINESIREYARTTLSNEDVVEDLAERLLKKGVIVPPCDLGDTVYYPWVYDGQCGIAFNKVESIKIYVNGLPIVVVEDWKSDMPMPICFAIDDFGETVFLTKKEAENKLKELTKNDC